MSSVSGSDVPTAAGDAEEIACLSAENRSLRSALERRLRWRRILTIVLVVLTSVSVVTASTALWVHQVVFDTDRFMETVEPALESADFYALIGGRASQSALEALGLEARVIEALDNLDRYLSEALVDALEPSDQARTILDRFDRPTLAALAPSITAALEGRIDGAIHAFFSSEAFVSRFPGLVRRVHQAAVALARDDLAELPNVYVAGGEVRLNLIPFIAEALRSVADDLRALLPDFDLPPVVSDRVDEGREQIATAVQSRLPDDFGQVTIMSATTLSEIQDTAVQLDRYVWLAILAAIILLVVTIAVSPRRRATAIHLGIGVVVAVVLAEVLVRRIEVAAVDHVIDPAGAGLTADLVSNALSGLRTAELVLAVAAMLVAIVAYLVGRPAWVVRLGDSASAWTERDNGVSRLDAWVSAHAGPLRVAGIAVALAALFITGLQPIAVIVIALLLSASMWLVAAAVRRAAPAPGGVVGVGEGPRTVAAESTTATAPRSGD